jgi:uncharacterized membrane protein YfcA
MSLLWTSLIFFGGALFYSIAGFGGASFYLAILTLTRVPLDQIAVIALACNIMVVSTSSYSYVRNGHLQWHMVWPLLIASVPFAWVGGHIHLPATAYKLLLGFVLLISGIAIFIQARPLEHRPLRKMPRLSAAWIGAGLGLLSGVTGIGGGVFLTPILTFRRWGLAKQTAAASAVFILLNSASGLAARMDGDMWNVIGHFWPLFLAVWAGGQLGGRLGALRFQQITVRQVSSGVICSSGLRLLLSALI